MNTHFIHVDAILALHERSIILWKASEIELKESGFLKMVEENHAFNFKLWHAEDRARRDDLGHEFVYAAKREIDRYNQQRNDRMEMIDEFIITQLRPSSPTACPVHSETPGMMIDRLSIISLKIYYMTQQAHRKTASATHREACAQKLAVLRLQRDQLAACLDELIQEILSKTRTFCSYRQFKMYNDKNLNPQLHQDDL